MSQQVNHLGLAMSLAQQFGVMVESTQAVRFSQALQAFAQSVASQAFEAGYQAALHEHGLDQSEKQS